MADFLLQATLSNLLVSTGLALIAWLVQRRYRAASLAHFLWVIVLIKMVTPPLFSVPVLEVESVAAGDLATIDDEQPAVWTSIDEWKLESGDDRSDNRAIAATSLPASAEPPTRPAVAGWIRFLCVIWITVSVSLLVVSSIRIVRFHVLLRSNLDPPTATLSEIAQRLAGKMELARTPPVAVSQANISPFVWWRNRRPLIVVPQMAVVSLNDADLQAVVAHEMAHIKRRDHWVRWLEWLTLLALWWNPILWWARRQLRVTEEIACDVVAIQAIHGKRHEYAGSLLNMAELLTTSAIRPPAVASAINSGGVLEKRLTMIIAEKTLNIPRWLRAAVMAVAVGAFPIGLVDAQDYEAVERRLGAAVEAGELSLHQASAMMEVLQHSSRSGHDEDREVEARKRRYAEITEDIKAAVEAGKLSYEEAEERLVALRHEIFEDEEREHEEHHEHGEHDEDRELEARKHRFMEIANKIKEAVESGELSEEDAEEKLIALRREMFEREEHEYEEERELEARKHRYMDIAREIEGAVEAGKMSEAEAEEKLNAFRREIFESDEHEKHEDRELEARKRRYMAIAEEIEHAVTAGKMSKEDAEAKLIALRREMFEREEHEKREAREHEDRELVARRRRFMEIAEEIKEAVEAGKMTVEDAEEKLNALKGELFEDEEREKEEAREHEARERHAIDVSRDIKAAVEAGRMSGEEAKERLRAVRRELIETVERETVEAREVEARERRFEESVRDIEAAVKSGKLSKEEAEERLIELRRDLFEDE